MISPDQVSAVLVTRGNVDMSEIVESIRTAGVDDIVIWNNAERSNVSCFGRYLGIAEAKHDWIYHQDDDLIVPVADVLAEYDPVADMDTIVCNNRADEEWRLTAIGCVFHRSLAACFGPYIDLYGEDADFYRVCDVVFAYQHPYRKVTLGYRDLPNASDPASSMYLEPGHIQVRERARARTLELAGVAA